MFSWQNLSIFTIASILTSSLIPNTALAANLITSTASGSSDIVPVNNLAQKSLKNGDFLIQRIPSDLEALGDGKNDRTWWDFDFSSTLTSITDTLNSAFLSLTLTPQTNSYNDGVKIRGFDFITEPFANLQLGQTQTVNLNLLDYYSSTELISYFNDRGGLIKMEYVDDALVSDAALTLDIGNPVQSVPEPTSVLTFLAVGGAVSTLKRRQKQEV
jgi:hypothetical protein